MIDFAMFGSQERYEMTLQDTSAAPESIHRVLIVQYAGDLREAFQRRQRCEGENYYAQWHSLDAVFSLANSAQEVATLCCISADRHDEYLAPRLRSIAAGFQTDVDGSKLIDIAENFRPTHLILRTPMVPLLRWAVSKRIRVIATLADSFSGHGFRVWFRNRRLKNILNRAPVEWVANHGWNASCDLLRIGVDAGKVIPWDWLHRRSPHAAPPKAGLSGQTIALLFVGLVQESKGVGDVIRAVQILNGRGISASLTIIGKGDIAHFSELSLSLGQSDQIDFRGPMPNSDIVPAMAAADIVVIPSRHDYPEGFPMTIYEALCSRSPIVASDHPMFSRFLRDRETALVFEAGNPQQMADSIQALQSEPATYAKLSARAAITWDEIQVPFEWGELIQRWCAGEAADFAAWVRQKDAETGFRARLQKLAG